MRRFSCLVFGMEATTATATTKKIQNMNTTTINGRTFELTQQAELPRLAADLKSRGFDGNTWVGVSQPTGRQRKTFTVLFYRTQAGAFVRV